MSHLDTITAEIATVEDIYREMLQRRLHVTTVADGNAYKHILDVLGDLLDTLRDDRDSATY